MWQQLREVIVYVRASRAKLRDTYLILGHGRSGSTWLVEMLNASSEYRVIFEPFNKRKNRRLRNMPQNQNRPQLLPEDSYRYKNILKGLLMGKTLSVKRQWVNRVANTNRWAKRRLVKEILFNRMAGWLRVNFPEVKIIVIVRDPYSVAFSATKRGWVEKAPIDYYKPPESIINRYMTSAQLATFLKAESQFQKNMAMWALDNLLLLAQLEKSDMVTSVYYENLVRDPETEFERLAVFCDHTFKPLGDEVRKRSKTVAKYSVIDPDDAKFGRAWEGEITRADEKYAQKLLKTFDLDKLYGERNIPNYAQPLDCRIN